MNSFDLLNSNGAHYLVPGQCSCLADAEPAAFIGEVLIDMFVGIQQCIHSGELGRRQFVDHDAFIGWVLVIIAQFA